jgi:hypothetical protein
MRLNYSDDEDYPGQFNLWQANCARSLRGKAGQAELRELEAALVALPEKRLIHGALTDEDGGVCAVACYARHKGIDLSTFDPEYESDDVGVRAGMPRLVAWKVVALNDIELESWCGYVEGPATREESRYAHRGVWVHRDLTPEERYEKVLAWVREQLKGGEVRHMARNHEGAAEPTDKPADQGSTEGAGQSEAPAEEKKPEPEGD